MWGWTVPFPFKNLVFEGAGVRNCGYSGALTALAERGIYGQVEKVAGTSAGSIVATLVALGYSAEELRQQMLDLDFAAIMDGSRWTAPFRLFSDYGLYKGDYFLAQMEEVVAKKTGDKRTTFAQMRAKGFKPLQIIGSNVTTRSIRVFPDEKTQDLAVAEAVRISMSIPLFFAARKLDGHYYVDGGVMWNYPIELFDTEDRANPETLGFLMGVPEKDPNYPVHHLHDLIGGVFSSILSSEQTDIMNNPIQMARSVWIDDLGIKATQFDISQEQKLALMDSGAKATRAFLDKYEARATARVGG